MKYHYCTLFDKNYLPHCLSLYQSLEKNVDSFVLYCFCMDNESYDFLSKNNREKIKLISSNELEIYYPELIKAKSNRSIVEYYFTCTPSICSFIFEKYDIGLLTYLDADLYFFSSPKLIYQELKNHSVGIIEHRFSFWGKVLYEKYGKFNVGWISFKNNHIGRKCLEDWRQDCLDWCYDKLENGKFADQKYLDNWPLKYPQVRIIQNLGANLAPWNIGNYKIIKEKKNNLIKVNNESLIFYHFASFKQIQINQYKTSVSLYFTYLTNPIKTLIYLPYLSALIKFNKQIGIAFNIKNRVDKKDNNFLKNLKTIINNFREFIFNDIIKIN